MVDISKIRVGDRVHYIPYKDCNPEKYENGIVKSIPDHTNSSLFVVFNCAGDWDNYKNYTAAMTPISKINIGWYDGTKS